MRTLHRIYTKTERLGRLTATDANLHKEAPTTPNVVFFSSIHRRIECASKMRRHPRPLYFPQDDGSRPKLPFDEVSKIAATQSQKSHSRSWWHIVVFNRWSELLEFTFILAHNGYQTRTLRYRILPFRRKGIPVLHYAGAKDRLFSLENIQYLATNNNFPRRGVDRILCVCTATINFALFTFFNGDSDQSIIPFAQEVRCQQSVLSVAHPNSLIPSFRTPPVSTFSAAWELWNKLTHFGRTIPSASWWSVGPRFVI